MAIFYFLWATILFRKWRPGAWRTSRSGAQGIMMEGSILAMQTADWDLVVAFSFCVSSRSEFVDMK